MALCCCCCVVFCGITCLANVDADEISKSFERTGADGAMGEEHREGISVYEPPEPATSLVAVNSGEATIVVDGPPPPVSYGSFLDSPSNQSAWISKGTNDHDDDLKEGDHISPASSPSPQIPHPHLLPATTIDADID